MEVDAITPEIARYYQLSKDNGIYVNRIYRNTAADESGIEPGDIITAINGEPINNSDSFYMAVGDAMVGDKLKVEVLRGEKKSTHTLVIRKER